MQLTWHWDQWQGQGFWSEVSCGVACKKQGVWQSPAGSRGTAQLGSDAKPPGICDNFWKWNVKFLRSSHTGSTYNRWSPKVGQSNLSPSSINATAWGFCKGVRQSSNWQWDSPVGWNTGLMFPLPPQKFYEYFSSWPCVVCSVCVPDWWQVLMLDSDCRSDQLDQTNSQTKLDQMLDRACTLLDDAWLPHDHSQLFHDFNPTTIPIIPIPTQSLHDL